MVDEEAKANATTNQVDTERFIQLQIQKYHSEIYRQSSIRSTKNVKTNNLHFKIRRFYSMLLVKYHWKILLIGFIISCTLTGLGFLKQPLPNIMDPSRGFGARGTGTLTSQLIVMKNINTELTKYHKQILELYEQKKQKSLEEPSVEEVEIETPDDDNDDDVDDEKHHSVQKRQSDLFDLTPEEQLEQLKSSIVYKDLTASQVIEMLEEYPELKIDNFPKITTEFNTCNFSYGLDENLEFYFDNKQAESLFTLDKIKTLCEWDTKILRGLSYNSKCYVSFPRLIQLISNKTSCTDLTEIDLQTFQQITTQCSKLHNTGILYTFAETAQAKSDIINLIDKNKPINQFIKLKDINQYLCSYKNLMYIFYEHIVDKNYMEKSNVKYSALIINNPRNFQVYSNDFIFNYYLKNYHGSNYKHEEINGTELYGINLSGIRLEAAMKVIGSEMSLIALAITLIVIVTLLYLRSIFISMVVNLGVAVSVGVSFFFYRIVFDIVLFPFLNMMAAFLLIGIACDDVYVLFDSWYTEKAKIIMEDLPEEIESQYGEEKPRESLDHAEPLPPIFIKNKFYKPTDELGVFESIRGTILHKELIDKGIKIEEYTLNSAYVRIAPLNDDQMIRAMSGCLHHAASSIFVTSFTTAAAFMTNLIAKLPYVQLFGFFTGSCILVYFFLVITLIAAFVVTYEKYLQHLKCKIRLNCLEKLEKSFEKLNSTISLINHKFICELLPKAIIKFRVVWFCIFFILGCIGIFIVFVQPKLKPNSKWRYEFFKKGNKFENFEFSARDEFLAYVNNEQRNLTNPEIFFVFGIHNEDTGKIFDPDDSGHLVYDTKFNFLNEKSQLWLNKFINETLHENKELFISDEITREWVTYLKQMQLFCSDTLGLQDMPFTDEIFLPFESKRLEKCQEETNKMLTESDLQGFEELMGTFPRRIIFISNGKEVTGVILRVNANRTFYDYETVNFYYHELETFRDKYIKSEAPEGFNSGWFISIAFALYDLQYQLITGTYSSLVASMIIAWVFLLFTSGNIFIALYAIITISFSIADTIAIFVLLGWELSILESVVIIMSVGLSVDFACHYGVAYINSDREFKKADRKLKLLKKYDWNNKERAIRIGDIFRRVGSAVFMAALTTFLSGMSMSPSGLTSFSKMGQFLMLVMCTSYLYSTFFFVSMCALFGPTQDFGNLNFKDWGLAIVSGCYKKAHRHKSSNNIKFELGEDEHLNQVNMNQIKQTSIS